MFRKLQVFLFLFVSVYFTFCKKPFILISHNSKPFIHIPHNSKPNIILILEDDVGYEVPTCNGGQAYSTPNMDMLSANGIRFTQCHSDSLCSPSRVELLTGKFNFRNYTEWGYLDRSNKTFANMLKDSGYATGVFGKWQLGGGDASITAFGFDNYIAHDALDIKNIGTRYKTPHLYTHAAYIPYTATQDKYSEDIITDSMGAFMEKNVKAGTPFFVYYPMILSHEPWQLHQMILNMLCSLSEI